MTATLLAALVGDGLVELDGEIGRWLAAGPNASHHLATARHPHLGPAPPGAQSASWLGRGQSLCALHARARRARSSPGGAHARRGLRLLELRPVPPWDFPLPGPGGVEATIGDLASYLRACLAPPETALGAAIRMAQAPQLRVDERREVGLGWIIRAGRVWWHNGGTGGFTASLGIDRAERRALAILVNTHGKAASQLDTAVLLGLAGGDPRQARPQRQQRAHAHAPGPRLGHSGPGAGLGRAGHRTGQRAAGRQICRGVRKLLGPRPGAAEHRAPQARLAARDR